MKIQFLGAAGTVTGSKYLVTHNKTKVLVDCGLYQGLKNLRLMNWNELPFEFEDLDAIILTHAHIDHSGFIPVLHRFGYRGPVYATEPTVKLCEILLPDAGFIQEEDAAYANKKGFSKHKPALPLYTQADAVRSLGLFNVKPLKETFRVGDIDVTFRMAGHILGAAHATLSADGEDILFSGDIGRYDDLLELPPDKNPGAKTVVMESTYGDRCHSKQDPVQEIADLVQSISDRKGVMVIPAFAVGRAQTLVVALQEAFEQGWAPEIPVYVNSPMTTRVTDLYRKYPEWHKLSPEECDKACANVTFIRDVEESKRLHLKSGPMIIISASGMLTGGRVLHHVKHFGGDPKNMIVLAGFQAPGTRGAVLAAGGRRLKIHGEYVSIGAEVVNLGGLSAHADQDDLLHWFSRLGRRPENVFITHGESQASDELRRLLTEQFGVTPIIPALRDSAELA